MDGVGAAGSNEGTQRAEDKAVPKLASRPHVGREIPRSDRYCRELIGGEFPVIQGRSGFSSVLSVVRCRSGGPKVGGSNPLSPTPENPCFGGDSRRFGLAWLSEPVSCRPSQGREPLEEESKTFASTTTQRAPRVSCWPLSLMSAHPPRDPDRRPRSFRRSLRRPEDDTCVGRSGSTSGRSWLTD